MAISRQIHTLFGQFIENVLNNIWIYSDNILTFFLTIYGKYFYNIFTIFEKYLEIRNWYFLIRWVGGMGWTVWRSSSLTFYTEICRSNDNCGFQVVCHTPTALFVVLMLIDKTPSFSQLTNKNFVITETSMKLIRTAVITQ